MLPRLVALLALTSALAAAGCATGASEASKSETGPRHPTTFESWAVGNGTGSFFRPIGPGGGSGVTSGWP